MQFVCQKMWCQKLMIEDTEMSQNKNKSRKTKLINTSICVRMGKL